MSRMVRVTDMTARILITGAGGFVGPWLLRSLQAGRFSESRVLCWSGKAMDCPTESIDILSHPEVARSVKDFCPTHVVHLAARSHVPSSFANPERTWAVNVMGTLNLIEAVRKYAPEAGLIFAGSSEVYGRTFQKICPVDESSPLDPLNPYAASKAAADIMAGQYATSGMRIVRVRPFNHIGPGQTEDFVASAFAAQVARIEAGLQEPVLRVGNLDARRDFLDVRDVVRCYMLILESLTDLAPGTIMNVCSGCPRSIRFLLEHLLSLTTVHIRVETDASRMRPTEIPVAAGSAEIAHRLLGWKPQIAIEETLHMLLQHWRMVVRSGSEEQDGHASA